MIAGDEFDSNGFWIGRCGECGTDHDGEPPNTLRGAVACMKARGEGFALGGLIERANAAVMEHYGYVIPPQRDGR